MGFIRTGMARDVNGVQCAFKRAPFAMYDQWRPRSACAWSLPSLSICSTVDTNVLESNFLGWWFTVEPKYKYTKISLRLLSTIIIDQWNQTTHKMNWPNVHDMKPTTCCLLTELCSKTWTGCSAGTLAKTQIRHSRMQCLIRVCTVCLNYRKLKVKWKS